MCTHKTPAKRITNYFRDLELKRPRQPADQQNLAQEQHQSPPQTRNIHEGWRHKREQPNREKP